jgi:hypothetical protein
MTDMTAVDARAAERRKLPAERRKLPMVKSK